MGSKIYGLKKYLLQPIATGTGKLPTLHGTGDVGGMMIFPFSDVEGTKVLILPVLRSVTRPDMDILCRMALLKSEE